MAFRDFRDFIAVAEQRGKLRRVAKTVDRMWEPACLAKWLFQALPAADVLAWGLLEVADLPWLRSCAHRVAASATD